MAVDAEGNSASFFLACLLVSMVVTAHVSDRGGVPAHLIKFLLLIGVVAASLMYFTGTFALMQDMGKIVQNGTTSLRSAAGVAKFCNDIQTLAVNRILQMVVLITVVYLFLQALCVPGTVALNAVTGAVLGTALGVPYCTLLGTAGATCCYLLSSLVGVRLVERVDGRLMKGKGLAKIRLQVNRYRGDLFVYLLFLRLTPILPNWLVNLASPVVGVPLRVFALATCLGILPQTYLTVRFGAFARTTMGKSGPIVSLWDTLLLVVLGLAVLAAFWLKKRLSATTGFGPGVRSATAVVV
ncbi:SNARE associated golgi family protein [Trypanosoma conorhini]|uniref:SNARE associated golgi family protein n=1 Tax=Trypanosoma conorhini TaxID=83891 RepID=A0A3R7LFN4_9TRYP|nr:SNARE associated golgi family protein [Trypanosoma conorhini]RNF26360.1 SNARE associated golgi family protein [Trypanosoma conorhini]